MARLFYVHWNDGEALETVRTLRGAGHEVAYNSQSGPGNPNWKQLRASLPDLLIISLERLPSHGRHLAEWFWEAKSRREVPILFVGGKPEKVAGVREAVPEACFTSPDDLDAALTELLP